MSTQPVQSSGAVLPSGGRDGVGLGRFLLTLAGVLLAGLGTLASAGRPNQDPTGGGNSGDPGNGNGAPTLVEDESIGSLPIVGGGFTLLPPGLTLPGLRPSLYVAGPAERVFEALVGAVGSGFIQIEDLGRGRTRILFQGDLQVDFALTPFLDDALEVGMVTGAELGDVVAAIVYRGRIVTRTALRALQHFEVPVHEMLAIDELKSGVDLYTRDLLGAREHYRLEAHGGLLTMSSR